MVLAEATRIDGGSNHWVDRIDSGFGQLMLYLFMMTTVDLVMMNKGSADAIRRCSMKDESTIVLI